MSDKSPVLAIDARLYGNRSWAWRIATATVDRFVADYQDSYSKIVLIAHSRKVYDALPFWGNVKKALISCHFLFGKLFLVPIWLFVHRADIYFSPTSELPVWKPFGTKYVNMVHDLFMEGILDESTGKDRGVLKAIRHFVRTLNPLDSFYIAWLFRKAFLTADRTIAISAYSKVDAVSRYGLPSEKFYVIPIAADERYFEDFIVDDAFLAKLESKFGIVGKYVFTYDAVGDFESFSEIVSEACHANGLTWVILNRHDAVYAAFKRAKTKDNVIFIRDFVSDDDLANLVRGSEFVFFPSPGEWFWIPIAESLASWKLVVVPDITAMPEVGWEFVICYDPFSLTDLSDKFHLAIDAYGQFGNQSKSPFIQRYRWKNFAKSLRSIFADILSD